MSDDTTRGEALGGDPSMPDSAPDWARADAIGDDTVDHGQRSGDQPDELPPLDDHDAQRLLDGACTPADAPPGYTHLVDLLAAAAGPPRPDELAGEASALRAFRAAAQGASAPQASGDTPASRTLTARRWHALRRLASASSRRGDRATHQGGHARRRRRAGVAARPFSVLAALLLVGGLCAAAVAAVLTVDADRPNLVITSTSRPGAQSGGPASVYGAGRAGPTTAPVMTTPVTKRTGSNHPGSPRTTSPSDQGATPASHKGLCQILRGGKGNASGKGEGSPNKAHAKAFELLAAAAGGADRVDAYCQSLTRGKSSQATRPTQPGTKGKSVGSSSAARSATDPPGGPPSDPPAHGRSGQPPGHLKPGKR